MGGPILPALRSHFGIDAAHTGRIASAFPLGMFFAVFLFPALSDRIGRKPVLIVSYLGVGTFFVLQSLAVKLNWPFSAFLALRVAAGAFAGASTVVKAYIADMSDRKTLPQVMAYREAAGTLAFIFGPTLGGCLFSLTSLHGVVLASGLTSILAAALVFKNLRNPPVAKAAGVPTVKEETSETVSAEPKPAASKKRGMLLDSHWVAAITMMGVSFAYNFGQAFFDGFFPVLCAERFGWTPAVLGPVLTGLACGVFMISAFFYSRLVRRFGIVRVAVMGLLVVTAGLGALGYFSAMWAVGLSLLLYAIGVPSFTPSVPTILASCAPPRTRGLVLGVDSAVNAVARILSPVVLGVLYNRGPHIAFRGAALAVLTGVGLMVWQQARLRRYLEH